MVDQNLTESEQRKATALLNTFGEKFTKDSEGKLEANFGLGAANVRENLNKLGLKEGVDFTVGDGREGKIKIDPNALPDPNDAKKSAPEQSLGYTFAIEKALGIKVNLQPAYSSDKSHPFDERLSIETGSTTHADLLSAIIAKVRHEMGIPQKDMPIAWEEGSTSFSISVSDIKKYDQSHPGSNFVTAFNDILNKQDIDTGKTYKEEISRVVQNVLENKPELKAATASSSIPYVPRSGNQIGNQIG